MKVKDSYHPYAIITIIFWSLAYVFSRLAMQHFSPYALGFLRYAVASIFLIAIVIFLRVDPPLVKDIPWFIASGTAGFFLYMLTFNRGTAMVPSATSSVIISTAPVITALLARVIYKEKLAIHQWIATAIEFLGIIVLTIWDGNFTINQGIIWLILASASLSCYNILQRKMSKLYKPLTVTAYSIFAGTIMLCIFLPNAYLEIKNALPIQFAYIFILGVFASALAYISWAKAFSKAENTSLVSNYMFVTPFITALFGFVFAGEVPDVSTIVGGTIIMCGVLIFFKNSFVKPKNVENYKETSKPNKHI
ncbi:MAG: DMT family transporter [Parabacteroides sp.]|nr:DMT family transporter [Parabacteroides sp.]